MKRRSAQPVLPSRPYNVLITKPSTGEEETITVDAATDGMANTLAMVRTKIRFMGAKMEAFELTADGGRRSLLLNC